MRIMQTKNSETHSKTPIHDCAYFWGYLCLFNLIFWILACMCNAEGSENNLCNVDSGHCYCKPNIGGDNCEKCIDGFFGFPTCQGMF